MFDFLSKQFVDVIDWLEEPGQLAWRVPFADHEIQNGAKLGGVKLKRNTRSELRVLVRPALQRPHLVSGSRGFCGADC